MSYEINGTIKSVAEVQEFTNFKKREFVIETEDKYPQILKFEAHQEKTEMLNKFKIGDKVDVKFNIRGREHDGRVFNQLQAWSVNLISSNTVTTDSASSQSVTVIAEVLESDEDDIPF